MIKEAMSNLDSVIEKHLDSLIDKHRPGTLESERPALKSMMREASNFAIEMCTEIVDSYVRTPHSG